MMKGSTIGNPDAKPPTMKNHDCNTIGNSDVKLFAMKIDDNTIWNPNAKLHVMKKHDSENI